MMISQPIRASGSLRSAGSRSARSQVPMIRPIFLRKYRRTAHSVPIWVIAVNAAPGSSQPNSRPDDPQVGAGGDRQELGEALHQAQDDGFDPAHGQATRWVAGEGTGHAGIGCTAGTIGARTWRGPRDLPVAAGVAVVTLGGDGRLSSRGTAGARAQRPGRLAARSGHHDLGPGHRRGRGRDAAHGVRRRRRHAGRHRRRLRRRGERAHPGPAAGRRRPARRRAGRDQGRGPHRPGPMGRGASRGHLLAALDASLERLGAGPRGPLAAARLGRPRPRWRRRWPPATRRSPPGEARYIGISNFSGWQTAQAATWQRAWPGRHPDRQHPGRVLAAAARRRARGGRRPPRRSGWACCPGRRWAAGCSPASTGTAPRPTPAAPPRSGPASSTGCARARPTGWSRR